jgi:small-conductance mechanosensitive channel
MEAEAYPRPLRRVSAIALALALVGAAAAGAWRGWQTALLFLGGAAASYFSFASLREMVESFGPGARPRRRRLLVAFSIRYLILGGGAYVIVKFFGVNAIAALAGLFVTVAAIVADIFYELIHGT